MTTDPAAPEPFFESSTVTVWNADARDAWRRLPESSVDAIVTSPPYFGLRDYGIDGQLGLEDTPDAYITGLADLLTGYARVLRGEGSLWLNLGDTYSHGGQARLGGGPGDKIVGKMGAALRRDEGRVAVDDDFPAKCLLMIPERVALALIERGWILRNKVVWAKPNGMPESVRDRLATKWEYLFHLVRQRTYRYDLDAIREPFAASSIARGAPHRADTAGSRDADIYPHGKGGGGQRPDARRYLAAEGKNPGDVWTIPTRPYPEAHFAVYPPELIRRPILATVPEGGIVLDPFFGSGTTGEAARRLGRKCWGVELNPDYCALAAERFTQEQIDLNAS